MRIVTRADFDSIVCAILLCDALDITRGIKWVEPNEMQKRAVTVEDGDIIANLPFHENCLMWFDHHISNRVDVPFQGLFRVAPSAAGLIYEYYRDRFTRDFSELAAQADKIDAADLSMEEVLHPEQYPYILLSMTIVSHDRSEEPYWNLLVDLLSHQPLDRVLENEQVKTHCRQTIEANNRYEQFLKDHTIIQEKVSITDFRTFDKAPSGNRFLVYSLYPSTVVNVKIRYDVHDKNRMLVSVGHSIFNRQCNVNVGELLSNFEGGGHRGAGACSFSADKADDYLPKIIDALVKNEPNDQ
ncbi:MAG: exopolyphosphatase [Thermodesulfobacteriota bacterium]|nr:exopolyphosphatase [Thermodesulfobacteriota bacterium]